MKLVSITFGTTPRLPGLRPSDTGHIPCDNPGAMKGWKLAIRGNHVYFISPKGWQRSSEAKKDAAGPVTVFGPFAVGDVYFEWQCPDEVQLKKLLDGKLTWESPEFGWTPTPVVPGQSILAQVPAGQMGDA